MEPDPNWVKVACWKDRLRSVDAATLDTGLSPEGAREALAAALDALSVEALIEADSLGEALALRPYAESLVIPASTVFTAALEWCAVLLMRGGRVAVRAPRARAGLLPAMVEAARHMGLPLRLATDAEVGRADLVVAMGRDSTLERIRSRLKPGARFVGHGSAWSMAWATRDLRPLASDLALHDGRGCMSPALVLSPLPDAAEQLAEALRIAQTRWPVGEIDPAEAAAIRSRRALARVLGRVVEVEGAAVHVLPADHAVPASLPRTPVLVRVRDLDEALAVARRWGFPNTVGTDDPASATHWRALGASVVCDLGRMQRPGLIRLHGGQDWVSEQTGWLPEAAGR